jgi:hypothetical protein
MKEFEMQLCVKPSKITVNIMACTSCILHLYYVYKFAWMIKLDGAQLPRLKSNLVKSKWKLSWHIQSQCNKFTYFRLNVVLSYCWWSSIRDVCATTSRCWLLHSMMFMHPRWLEVLIKNALLCKCCHGLDLALDF